jgi:hypothetical protein
MPRTDIKPAFQAEYITGNFWRMIMAIEEDVRIITNATGEKKIITRKLVPKREEFPDGYMVYFPQGHSIFIAADDKEQLHRVGVLSDPRLVDMESGEDVPQDYNLSPKEIVERRTKNRPRPPGAMVETYVEENTDA